MLREVSAKTKTLPGKVSVSIRKEDGLARIQPKSRSVLHRKRIHPHGFRPFRVGAHHQAAAPERSTDKIRNGKLWKIGSNIKGVPLAEMSRNTPSAGRDQNFWIFYFSGESEMNQEQF